MIQDVGNVELFELFKTDHETPCKERLSCWSEGVVYCTCGHLLKEIVANRGFIEKTLDFLSIPEYAIKKGRLHGHRYGKTPEKKEHHLVLICKRDASRGNSHGFTIVSYENVIFVNLCSNMIEMERFVSNTTILQDKISLIE